MDEGDFDELPDDMDPDEFDDPSAALIDAVRAAGISNDEIKRLTLRISEGGRSLIDTLDLEAANLTYNTLIGALLQAGFAEQDFLDVAEATMMRQESRNKNQPDRHHAARLNAALSVLELVMRDYEDPLQFSKAMTRLIDERRFIVEVLKAAILMRAALARTADGATSESAVERAAKAFDEAENVSLLTLGLLNAVSNTGLEHADIMWERESTKHHILDLLRLLSRLK